MPSLLTKEQKQSLGLLLGGTLPTALLGFLADPQTVSAADIHNAANQNRARVTTDASTFDAEQTDVILATVEQQAAGYYLVRGNLNIRSGPGTSYGVIGRYSYGDTISATSITETTSAGGYTWLHGPKGWFANTGLVQYMSSGNSQTAEGYSNQSTSSRETNNSTYVVNTGSGAVYIMDSNNNRVGSLPAGGAIPLRGQDGNWYYVDGGYILKWAPGVTTSSGGGTPLNSGGSYFTGKVGDNLSQVPATEFPGGNQFIESGPKYDVTIVRGVSVLQQGSNYIVTLDTGASMTVPLRVSRIVKWQNGTPSGPGWLPVDMNTNWVQPSYLTGLFGYDGYTLVLSD